ncbi:HsdM family class I SAM-dependent methyltransferase [Pseudodesulfovibrio karagichevae]|uniref:Class I SAM-dependent DNA methyltransferase n=1 Tax=Pseudodesulfovibrio karagichevae TaxID=3239305 RepID=A0ABV4K7A9_9BACT
MNHNQVLSQEAKKRLGSFYTPEGLIAVLTDWAIRSETDIVLEPSFGGCGFIGESKTRLEKLGCNQPEKQIYGCDIDVNAFSYLDDILPGRNGNFLTTDFLATNEKSFRDRQFNVVLGNPPYVSHHNTTSRQKEVARKTCKDLGLNISKRASLWAYFVVHSIYFLKSGGRLAFVLPGSFLQAEYAAEVRAFIQKHFDFITAIVLHDRLFLSEGTEENTVILLAEGFRREADCQAVINVAEAKSIENLKNQIWALKCRKPVGTVFDSSLNMSLMKPRSKELFDQLANMAECRRAGDLFSIIIGIVTGDNKFFVVDREHAENHQLYPRYSRPLLAKITNAPGLSFTQDDYLATLNSNKPCLLIDTDSLDKGIDQPIRDYLASYSRKKRRSVKTFKKRSNWHSPDDHRIPDAFFTYMKQECPRIVLNEHGLNCTNSIHRVFFNEDIPHEKHRLVALSLLTSFSQLSAEIEGKGYGSGVLKLEPNAAKRIKVLLPELYDKDGLDNACDKADRFLREGNTTRAIEVADAFFLTPLERQHGVNYKSYFQEELALAQIRRQHIRSNRG